jgi:nuclear-control-of-ATPase protein 2
MIEHAVRVIGSHMLQSVVNQWWRRRQHKPRNGLPLLLTTTPPDSLEDTVGVERVLDILGDASAQVLEHLHEVNKHLQFWQIRAQGTERDKVRFMVLERGPWAFLQGVRQLLRSLVWDSSTQGLVVAAAIRITERVSMLTDLRNRLAVLNGQVCAAIIMPCSRAFASI